MGLEDFSPAFFYRHGNGLLVKMSNKPDSLSLSLVDF